MTSRELDERTQHSATHHDTRREAWGRPTSARKRAIRVGCNDVRTPSGHPELDHVGQVQLPKLVPRVLNGCTQQIRDRVHCPVIVDCLQRGNERERGPGDLDRHLVRKVGQTNRVARVFESQVRRQGRDRSGDAVPREQIERRRAMRMGHQEIVLEQRSVAQLGDGRQFPAVE